ncbi:DUF4199 domain-containing protein [Mucilaginibacter limnophilus]|uniref:DUF4199 domain-containing protein n=1 Tax=Mucilaginibacter limnophilus TaxID=1932778 RepID=A0A437MYR7_9SPHI|nr:DUF4199 domain-containing protein [Mucilaginibacter limnophilus]RVU02798.1 DUF4199 domain-containing protein [Mucilaginibacter limnophilus]
MAELVADSTVRKSAVTSGLILGVVSSVLSILSFYFTTTMTTSMWLIIFSPLIFSIIIPIVIAIFLILDLRKKIGGFWSFKQATTGTFIMFIISSIVSFLLVSLLFAKVIEPNMIDKSRDSMVNAVTAMMEKTSQPQESVDKAIADINKKFDEQRDTGAGKMVMGLGIMVIISFILALIFGAIFKKEPPRYIVQDTDPTV